MNNVSSAIVNPQPNTAVQRAAPAKAEVRPIMAAAVTAAQSAFEQPKPSAETVQRASNDLQQRVAALAPELKFSVDENSGRSVIKFTDRITNEVIRQFPTEEALHLTKIMDQFQRGLLFNRKA